MSQVNFSLITSPIYEFIKKGFGSLEHSMDVPIEVFAKKLAEKNETLSPQEMLCFCDLVLEKVKRGKYTAMGITAVSFLFSQYMPFMGTFFKVGAIFSALIAYDLGQIGHAVMGTKKYFEKETVNLNWNDCHSPIQSIKLELIELSNRIQKRVLMLTNPWMFNQKINDFPHFIERKMHAFQNEISPKQVKWASKSDNRLFKLFSNPFQAVKLELSSSQSLKASQVDHLVKQILKSLTHLRSTFMGASLILYTFSKICFGTVNLISAIACGFFAWEIHNIYETTETTRKKLSESYFEPISWKLLLEKFRNWQMCLEQTSYLMQMSFFKDLINQFLTDLDKLNHNT